MRTIETKLTNDKHTNDEKTLAALFPGMDAVSIKESLNEAKGKAQLANAIVLLLQTSTPSSSPKMSNQHQDTDTIFQQIPKQKQSKHKQEFMKYQIDKNKFGSCYRTLAITYWSFMVISLIITLILSIAYCIISESK
eukprot:248247_1